MKFPNYPSPIFETMKQSRYQNDGSIYDMLQSLGEPCCLSPNCHSFYRAQLDPAVLDLVSSDPEDRDCAMWYYYRSGFDEDVSDIQPVLFNGLAFEWLLYSEVRKEFFVWDSYSGLWCVGKTWVGAVDLWWSRSGIPVRFRKGENLRKIRWRKSKWRYARQWVS